MLLMARGVTGAMSYTAEYYGSHGRPKVRVWVRVRVRVRVRDRVRVRAMRP